MSILLVVVLSVSGNPSDGAQPSTAPSAKAPAAPVARSGRELADAARTSRVNVGRIETGGDTTPGMARRLADALECRIDDLMGQSSE